MTNAPETNTDATDATTPKEAADDVASASQSEPNNDTETNNQPTENKKEIGGRGGLDPARYGDWEVNGRCYDF